MKRTNIILSTVAIVGFTFSLVLLISCNKGKTKYNDSTLVRPCDNIICLNGGTCNDGLCYCPQGFEGKQCATKWSDRFVGNYVADDECDTSPTGYYNASIFPDADYAYKLKLSDVGLFCKGNVIYAQINPEKTSFEIPMQNTCGNTYLSGYGNINGDFLNIYLISRDTILHATTTCSIVMDKQ